MVNTKVSDEKQLRVDFKHNRDPTAASVGKCYFSDHGNSSHENDPSICVEWKTTGEYDAVTNGFGDEVPIVDQIGAARTITNSPASRARGETIPSESTIPRYGDMVKNMKSRGPFIRSASYKYHIDEERYIKQVRDRLAIPAPVSDFDPEHPEFDNVEAYIKKMGEVDAKRFEWERKNAKMIPELARRKEKMKESRLQKLWDKATPKRTKRQKQDQQRAATSRKAKDHLTLGNDVSSTTRSLRDAYLNLDRARTAILRNQTSRKGRRGRVHSLESRRRLAERLNRLQNHQ